MKMKLLSLHLVARKFYCQKICNNKISTINVIIVFAFAILNDNRSLCAKHVSEKMPYFSLNNESESWNCIIYV